MRNCSIIRYLVIALAIIGLAGAAQAGQMAVRSGDYGAGTPPASLGVDQPVTVAEELITTSGGPKIDLDGTTGASTPFTQRNILYNPTIDLPTLSTIKFQFEKGGVEKTSANNYYLRIAGKTDANPTDTWQVATLVDFTTVTINSVDYYKSMTFRVVDHSEGGVSVDRITANATVIMTQSSTTEDPPVVKLDSSGDDMTVSIPLVKDETGTEKQAPLVTGARTVAKVQPGIVSSLQPVTSTIDVNPGSYDPRTVFVAGAGTTLTTSMARLTVTSNADVGFLFGVNDLITMTISRSNNAGVTKVDLGTGSSDTTATSIAGMQVYTLTGNFSTIPLTSGQYVTITVDSTTPLQVGDWLMNLEVNPASTWGVDPDPQTVIPGTTTSHSWRINGSQFAVPYFHTRTATYGTDLLITNNSSLAAGVLFDVVTEGGQTTGVNIVCAPPYDQVPANSTLLIPATAIQDAAQLKVPALAPPAAVRYSGYFTVNAAQDQIIAVALQRDATGAKRTIPIYKPTSENISWKE
jgi:hypothetical protein